VKSISPRTVELLESLFEPPGLLARWLKRVEPPPAAALAEIVETGELEATLALLALAMAGTPHHRQLLLTALDQLVRSASPGDLARLDLRARTISEWRREGWAWSTDVTPERTRAIGADQVSAAGIASLHNFGYVREAAVEVLAGADDPLAIAFLLIRANDWVDPVRQAAARGLQAHLARGGAARFVPYLELVDRLQIAGRANLRPLADAILGALGAPDAAAALRQGCSSKSRVVRRRCFEIAFSARTFDVKPLALAGLRDDDTVIRVLAAKGAVQALAWSDLRPLIDEMLASTTPAARFAALEALWKEQGIESRPVQERFALDPHSHVRGTARWFLKSVPGFDSAVFYRGALAGSIGERELVGALEGLGEVGVQDDSSLVAPFLRHQSARVRASAIHALGSLGSKAVREEIVLALSDPSAKVCRAARTMLLRGAPLDPDRLAFAALSAHFPHERRAVVALAGAHDHWVAGILLLRIASTTDPATAKRVGEALSAWESRYNRVFTSPTRHQVDEFESRLAAATIDEDLRQRLLGLLPALKRRWH